MAVSTPTPDDIAELLLSCRYGDTEDIQHFITRFGPAPLNDARDDNRNTVTAHGLRQRAHRRGADALDLLLPLVAPPLLAAQNAAQSTALHWAALNRHLAVAQRLVRHPGGPGIDLIDLKNGAGRSPLGEAENAGWEEGAKWFVEVMHLDEGAKEDELHPAEGPESIEVEIQDAEGQVAKMTIGQPTPDVMPPSSVTT